MGLGRDCGSTARRSRRAAPSAILFTGETYGGGDGGFGALSVVTVMAGHKAFLPMLLAAAVAALVGSAGRWRFVLLLPCHSCCTRWSPCTGADLFSALGLAGASFRIMGATSTRRRTSCTSSPYPTISPRTLRRARAPGHDPGRLRHLGHPLRGEPRHLRRRSGADDRRSSTISFEDGAGPSSPFSWSAPWASFSPRAERPGPAARGRGRGIVVVVLVLLVPRMPFSDETVTPGCIDWTRIGTGGTSRLDVQADVGRLPHGGEGRRAHAGASSEPLLWRGGTMDYFDGVRWTDTTEPGLDDGEEIAAGCRDPNRAAEGAGPERPDGPHLRRVQDHCVPPSSGDPELRRLVVAWTSPSKRATSTRCVSEIPQPTGHSSGARAATTHLMWSRSSSSFPADSRPWSARRRSRSSARYNPRRPTTGRARSSVPDLRRRLYLQPRRELPPGGQGYRGVPGRWQGGILYPVRHLDGAPPARHGVPSRVVYGATTGEEVRTRESTW